MGEEIAQKLKERGFYDELDECFHQYNEEDVSIEDALNEIKEEYSIFTYDSDQVFDSPGMDIYCYAIAYSGKDGICVELISAYSY